MNPARALPWVCAILLIWLAVGCASTHRITGPKWSPRRAPIAPRSEIADHTNKDRLLFLVFGDSGMGNDDQKRVGTYMVLECAARGGCDFALMTGDNIYPVGARRPKSKDVDHAFDSQFIEKFEIAYEPLGRMDFWTIPGNHDWFTRGSVEQQVRYTEFSDRWRMLSHDYAVPDLPDWIGIYALDTTKIAHRRVDGQLGRARRALRGGAGWKLLVGHHPVYSSGKHAPSNGEFPLLGQSLLPMIESYGVHLYLSGHEHHQEHLSSPAFDQIIQGAAADPRRIQEVENRSPWVRQLAGSSRFGFALIEATAERLEMRFFGYDDDQAYGEFYCRVFDFDEFADPDTRSRPCRVEDD